MRLKEIEKLTKLIRYWILQITTKAGSGHPTSALSATDLMTVLFFNGYYRYDCLNPENPYNDRIIFSKGHATPLFYSLYAAAGLISEKELMTYRDFKSNLEGHPTKEFKFTEAATGSLGQGLSIGLGLALALRLYHGKNTLPRVYVLLGDGEMAEGSVWEAIQVAGFYKAANLVAVLDVNRLGQSRETMIGFDIKVYQKRVEAFGWKTIILPDGHNLEAIDKAYKEAIKSDKKPTMIIAKTVKGKGVSFLENKEGWHGKTLDETQLKQALVELGRIDRSVRGELGKPNYKAGQTLKLNNKQSDKKKIAKINYREIKELATRKAYGKALVRVAEVYPNIVALDGDVNNSTYSELLKQKFPERFFEMFIAEQNMVGAALGMQRLGFIPFVSTFSAFLTRAFDQIRMAAITKPNIKFIGSHAGVSIGQDGASQMGLEDLAMFRSIYNCKVLYPADAVSTERLVEEMAVDKGMVYLRTGRPDTPVLYQEDEKFPIGGFKIHAPKKIKKQPQIVIIAAGITLNEALKAQQKLEQDRLAVVVVDCYTIRPIDEKGLQVFVKNLPVVVVEDHWFNGGLGDAVLNVFSQKPEVKVYKMAVIRIPHSGTTAQNLAAAGIDADAIVKKVRSVIL